jgi:hypothetical protein
MPLPSIQVRKGVRVVFSGPPPGEITLMFNRESHHLMGQVGTIVYGISEDVWCYPDDPQRDSVWVAFDGDRLERRQVAIAWLEEAEDRQ